MSRGTDIPTGAVGTKEDQPEWSENKAWWIVPIVVVLLLLAALVVFSQGAVAHVIYPFL